jgi:alpha-D-ribose 1-methylphosphonate 5-triphosphate synthase subunit PhnH
MTELSVTQTAIDSSRNFRAILDAMAKPGHVLPFDPRVDAPAPLLAGAATIVQTLCDFQSPIWLAPEFATGDISRFVKFHTGAPIIEDPAPASFGIVQASAAMPSLSVFSQGTHEYPDRSTTLIMQVDSFTRNIVVLSGPGLKESVNFGAQGLSRDFWQQMITNNQQYPLGVDVIFVSRKAIACCPRSTRIQLMEQA